MYSVTSQLWVLESFTFVCLYFKWVKKVEIQTDLFGNMLATKKKKKKKREEQ